MAATAPTYPTTCPICGAQLQPVALDALTAPWLCPNDGRGFWAADLSAAARAVCDAKTWTWSDPKVHAAVRQERDAELVSAVQRGTSLRDDQFAYAHVSVLQGIVGYAHIDPSFAAQIRTQLHNRGA